MATTEMSKWTPAVVLNLQDTGRKQMEAVIDQFREWSASQPPQLHGLKDGWHDITPQVAERLLRLNPPGANRKVSLATVQYYARQMLKDSWQRTGQPILISDKGVMLDSQHRCWAGYLSGCTFPSFVVTNIPHIDNVFAYIDNGKTRTPTDALQTAGLNGLSSKISQAVKIAVGYDEGAYGIEGDEKIPRLTPIDVLDYVAANPALLHAAHLQLSQYEAVNDLIGDKGVAIFAAWKIVDAYGDETLAEFMEELGDEENENTAVLLLRKKLLADATADKRMRKSLRLGFITKAFNAWRLKQPMTRLNLKTDEAWPRFIDTTVDAEAA